MEGFYMKANLYRLLKNIHCGGRTSVIIDDAENWYKLIVPESGIKFTMFPKISVRIADSKIHDFEVKLKTGLELLD